MKILALDTATEACSVALGIDDEVMERYEVAPRRHAEIILPMVDAILAEAGLRPTDLDVIAFGRGPGSFTGLRIAASVTQGIAFGADLPVVPISTLAAMARAAALDHSVSTAAVALDARMGEVYWAVYSIDDDGDAQALVADCVSAPEAVPLPLTISDCHGVGPGWQVYSKVLGERLAVVKQWPDYFPRAGDIAALGLFAMTRGETVTADMALPVYLRDDIIQVRNPGLTTPPYNKSEP